MEIPGVKARVDQTFDHVAQLVGVNPPCPFCANPDWTRAALGNVVEIRALTEHDAAAAEPLFTTALGFTCTRCGFVRLHEVDPASWGLPGAR